MDCQLGREFSNQLARVRKRLSEVGILYALQLLKWRLVSSRQIDANVWVVVSRDIRELAAVKDHDAAIRWATASDFVELISCGIKPAKLDVDFGRTLKIAVYEHEGRIIAFAQYAVRSWDQDDWLTFKFKPRDIHGAGVWVAQEHRGQNIASRVMAFAWSNYAQNGYERMVAITNALNRNSFRAAANPECLDDVSSQLPICAAGIRCQGCLQPVPTLAGAKRFSSSIHLGAPSTKRATRNGRVSDAGRWLTICRAFCISGFI